jgi:hypothetical protein
MSLSSPYSCISSYHPLPFFTMSNHSISQSRTIGPSVSSPRIPIFSGGCSIGRSRIDTVSKEITTSDDRLPDRAVPAVRVLALDLAQSRSDDLGHPALGGLSALSPCRMSYVVCPLPGSTLGHRATSSLPNLHTVQSLLKPTGLDWTRPDSPDHRFFLVLFPNHLEADGRVSEVLRVVCDISGHRMPILARGGGDNAWNKVPGPIRAQHIYGPSSISSTSPRKCPELPTQRRPRAPILPHPDGILTATDTSPYSPSSRTLTLLIVELVLLVPELVSGRGHVHRRIHLCDGDDGCGVICEVGEGGVADVPGDGLAGVLETDE